MRVVRFFVDGSYSLSGIISIAVVFWIFLKL